MSGCASLRTRREIVMHAEAEMHTEVERLRAAIRRLRALLVRATDKQARRALAESIWEAEGRLHRVQDATEGY
jgi:hypothetical protein